MSGTSKSIHWAFAVSLTLLAQPRVAAQDPDSDKITEEDKKAFKDFKEGAEKIKNAQRQKALQAFAISNLRQIGFALFEFETEYGSFPDGKTAAAVKEATGTNADLKAATANDCFFQLIASGIIDADRVFLLEPPAQKPGGPPKQPTGLEKWDGARCIPSPWRPTGVRHLYLSLFLFFSSSVLPRWFHLDVAR